MASTTPLASDSAIPAESIIYIRERQQAGAAPTCYDVYGVEEIDDAASQTAQQQSGFRLLHEQLSTIPQAWIDNFLLSEIPPHLRGKQDGRQVHVVVSTKSGTGRAANFERNVLHKVLHELGLRDMVTTGTDSGVPVGGDNTSYYHIVNTTEPRSIGTFAEALDISRDQTIIILSGDGGVIELLNVVDTKGTTEQKHGNAQSGYHEPIIAVLPLGTANALFNSLHKKTVSGASAISPLVQGLRTLFRGKDSPLPCFRADFSPGSTVFHGSERGDAVARLYGAIVASYGFHSQLVWESDTDEYRKHGDKRFQMVAGELLKGAHGYRATVELLSGSGTHGGREEAVKIDRDRHAYILATMVSNLERTFTISPHSKPLDNVLRLVHFGIGTGPAQGQRIMDVMRKAYDEGKHIGMQWTDDDEEADVGQKFVVGYDEVPAAVKITTHESDERWRKVCIDGIIVEIPEGGSMTVAREAAVRLRILVDPRALEA